jgi:hypothetical protein
MIEAISKWDGYASSNFYVNFVTAGESPFRKKRARVQANAKVGSAFSSNLSRISFPKLHSEEESEEESEESKSSDSDENQGDD